MAQCNLNKDKIFLKYLKQGHFKVYRDGRILNTKTGNFLGTKKNSRGYGVVSIKHKDKIIHIQAHRLIWIALKGPITDPDAQVNHKDGNKINNNPTNFELTSASGNSQHAIDSGLSDYFPGQRNGNAKLTNKQVRQIKKLCKTYSQRKVALDFDVSKVTISKIVNGLTYKDA